MSANQLRQGGTQLGFWCPTGHPGVVDTAAAAGPDWICIDAQHGVDLGTLDASLFTLIATYGVASLMRVPAIEDAAIGRALDLGANGVVVPLVNTAEDARRAVAATRHAPSGSRSFGMQTNRVGPFDEEPFVAVQVETSSAVDNLDAIAAVDGVDAFYIWPADLGLALAGKPAVSVDEIFDGEHPEVAEACGSVVEAARQAGIVAGLHCRSGGQARRAVEAGFGMMSVTSDLGSIAINLTAQLNSGRG